MPLTQNIKNLINYSADSIISLIDITQRQIDFIAEDNLKRFKELDAQSIILFNSLKRSQAIILEQKDVIAAADKKILSKYTQLLEKLEQVNKLKYHILSQRTSHLLNVINSINSTVEA